MNGRLLTLGLGAWLLGACSGQLLLFAPTPPPCTSLGCACSAAVICDGGLDCVDGRCAVPVCSVDTPSGACPSGRTCSSGVCVLEGAGGFCQCAPGQGCGRNGCESINDTNGCSTSNTIGLCPLGQVCVSGVCEVVGPSNECSITRPDGLCPAGAGCDGGVCIPIQDKQCSPAHLDGLCIEGLVCVSPGICDFAPCSPQWPQGKCESGLFCSSKSTCIALGTCAGQTDCTAHFTCTSSACVRDPSCQTTSDCLTGEHCLASGTCALLGKCGVSADCASGQTCSTSGNCLDPGHCETQADCASPKYCASNLMCLDPGQCGTMADCPPGEDCPSGSCVLAGTLCTAGTTSPTACPTGMRCSSLGSCIYNGSCTADSDCLSGYFKCTNYTCQPLTPCTPGSCPAGQTCSGAGGCMPTGDCVVTGDCPAGNTCGPSFTCIPASNCGNTQLGATLVKPNMLVVLDRSGSMATCDAACDSRWNAATRAINIVLGAYSDRIRFGLSTFPHRCADDPTTDRCGLTCTAQCSQTASCNDTCPVASSTQNCNPGVVDVAVSETSGTGITSALSSNNPGGYTPTGATLSAILQNPGSYGLPDPADTVKRGNYILLVTDGEPNCDTHPALRVDGYLDSLRKAGIPTYVVGISTGSGTAFTALNCFAVYGGTSSCGTQVTASTCSGSPLECSCKTVTGNTQACFFPASDQTALSTAFNTIIGSVATCSYTLSAVPPQLTQLYVYLQYPGSPPTLTAVPQNSATETNGWTWLPATSQLSFSGTSCTALKAGTATPVIYYGCSTGG